MLVKGAQTSDSLKDDIDYGHNLCNIARVVVQFQPHLVFGVNFLPLCTVQVEAGRKPVHSSFPEFKSLGGLCVVTILST